LETSTSMLYYNVWWKYELTQLKSGTLQLCADDILRFSVACFFMESFPIHYKFIYTKC